MKILLLLSSLLFCTLTTLAQQPKDANGFSPNSIKTAPSFPASNIDSNFVQVDTLHFASGYTVGPGQLSKDGLDYYSSLTFNTGSPKIYVSKRSALNDNFGSPQLLPGLINDTLYQNSQPSITADRKTIVFVRTHINMWDSTDLYIATRSDTSLPFDSVRALSEVNSPGSADAYPWISPDGLRLYFTNASGLVVAARQSTNNPFGSPVSLTINYSGSGNFSGWLSGDEKELFFTTGNNGDSVMYSSRTNLSDPFPAPVYIWSLSKNGFVAGISTVGDELYLYNVNYPDRNILIYHRIVTSVNEDKSEKPVTFVLNQNYPNPFNPNTTINYSISKEAHSKITIYNIIGSKVAVLVNENKPAGSYSVQFNAGNLPSGIYFYTLQTNYMDGKQGFTVTKKMMLLK